MSEEIKEMIAKWKEYIKHMEQWHDKYVERQKLLVNYIEQLQQENEHYKNILTEFEKWLKTMNDLEVFLIPRVCLEKLEELKGNK